jgi:hypothetical protein
LRNFIKHIRVNYITGDLEWIASRGKDGYGKFRITKDGKRIHLRAHRVAYETATGILISEGTLVCHKSDNPIDVNPNHLFEGTPDDNSKDMTNKGRQARGEAQGSAKLTWKEVNEIRYKYNYCNISRYQLSNEYNVTHSLICFIIKNKNWYDENYIRINFKKDIKQRR